MARTALIQMNLPRVEPDGVTHALECECPRCEAGFRPSDRQRREATARWRERQAREQAEVALARMNDRKRARALKLELALDEQARATDALLADQKLARERAGDDQRLTELLELRARGASVGDALATIERLPARRARR